jgi:hypothetical protein
MNKPITFKHSGNCGDIIYSLSSIKALCIDKATKAILYIHLDQPSTYTSEQHPVGNVMMNKYMYEMVKPLLEAQPYIERVVPMTDSDAFDYDLDLFRRDYLNLSCGNIAQWIGNTYPELRPNLYERSLFVDPIPNDYIIVNRTHRYNNLYINYMSLSNYENVYFVGTETEYKSMHIHNEGLKHLQCKDFLELARYIAGCRLFIGNQSMAFAIAEQLKSKRILEQHYHCPNVIPQGGEYWVFHTDEQFKKSLSHALNKNSNQTQNGQA